MLRHQVCPQITSDGITLHGYHMMPARLTAAIASFQVTQKGKNTKRAALDINIKNFISLLCHCCFDLNCSMPKDFSNLLTHFGNICRATNVNKIEYPLKRSEYWVNFKIVPTHDSIHIKSKKSQHSDDTRIFYKIQLKIETSKHV